MSIRSFPIEKERNTGCVNNAQGIKRKLRRLPVKLPVFPVMCGAPGGDLDISHWQ